MWRWRLAILACVFWFHGPLCAQTSIAPEDSFQKGLAAYQGGRYEEARDKFLEALNGGRSSAALFHDLALTYFQLDQKALAMAFWRKALAIDPSFGPARMGRGLLESRFNMSPWERDSFNLWIRRAMEAVSVFELAWLVALLLAIAGWLWIRYLAARQNALEEELPKPPFSLSTTVFTVILVAVLALMVFKVQMERTKHATVVAAKVSARSLPADDGVGLFDMAAGSEVIVRMREGDWFQVQNSEGSSGWVKKGEILVTDAREDRL